MHVAILAGGRSAEHDVSLQSGQQVLEHLDRSRWTAWPVPIARDGTWFVPERPWDSDREDAEAAFSVEGRSSGLRPGAAVDRLRETCGVEVVFPALHGAEGEDGRLQGLLELERIPFVGSRTAASAVAMDKLRTRECLVHHGVPMAAAWVADATVAGADPDVAARAIARDVGFPCFLKVDLSGSTLGVARADSPDDVRAFVDDERRAARGRRFLAERAVVGEEISVPVLGNADGPLEVLPAIGIYPVSDGYFTYSAKYDVGMCEEVVPPRGLDPDQLAAVGEIARRCHLALDCDGMSRTDMIVGEDGPVVLEVNTIPGLTTASLLPKAALAAGHSFAQLIDRLLELALERSGVGIPAR